jgi:hypothetical protein
MSNKVFFLGNKGLLSRIFCICFCVLAVFYSQFATAQLEPIDQRIIVLDGFLQQAVADEDFEAAAKIKSERQYYLDLRQAIIDEDGLTLMSLSGSAPPQYTYYPKGGKPVVSDNSAPEFINHVYAVGEQAEYIKLEKVEGNRVTAGGGFYGFSAKVTSYMVPGNESKVKMPSNQKRFIVRTISGIDPADMFELVKFDIRTAKKDRYVDMSKSNRAMYYSSKGGVTENRLVTDFKSLGNGVYEIVLTEDLEPGEYGFIHGSRFFAFGVEKN